MKIGNFRFGFRTLKTALAVFICILLFAVTQRGNPMIACLASVFAMREDLSKSLTFGTSRMMGNLIGGIFAIIYFFISQHFAHDFLIELIFIPLFIACTIILLDGFHNNDGIIGGVACLLMISLTIPAGQSFGYALHRLLDTVIGTIVTIGVNSLIKPPKQLAEPIDYQVEYMKQQQEIERLKQQLEQTKQRG